MPRRCSRGASSCRRFSLSARRARSTRGPPSIRSAAAPAAGSTPPAAPCRRNSEYTEKNDYKLDLRATKTFNITNRVRVQPIVEAFNILNTKNLTNYNGIVTASTYLQPASSTDVFYQPRQLQFAVRLLY